MNISTLEQQIKKIKGQLSGAGQEAKERAMRKSLKRAQRRRHTLIAWNAAMAAKAKGKSSESADAKKGG